MSRPTRYGPAPRRRTLVPARPRDERGSATVFVVGMAITLLACAGLVLDGGTALNARMRLADQVEQAARAGAQQIDVVTLRDTGAVVLDEGAARTRATTFLRDLGHDDGTVTVDDGQITVSATDTVDTVLLNLVGIQRFDVKATATSEAVTR